MMGFIRGLGVKQKEAEEQQKALRAILLQRNEKTRPSEEAGKAIVYCESCIHSYEDWFEWNETRWLRWQRVVIIGGVTATLAGIITVPGAWTDSYPYLGSPGWIRGVPAAIVTIAASYLSSFTYREDAVRHELTANALWSELARYQAQADPYNKNEKEDTSAFVNAVCRIVETELHSWSTLVVGRGAGDENKADDASKNDDNNNKKEGRDQQRRTRCATARWDSGSSNSSSRGSSNAFVRRQQLVGRPPASPTVLEEHFSLDYAGLR